jgi:hypothetical protein
MKLIRKLFISSIILSIGSIAGVSVWADSNDVFTLSDSYVFYWFVAITSLLFSLSSYLVHTIKSLINYTRQSTKLSNLHMYVVTIFGSIYTIFWLGASAGVGSNLRYCLVLNNFRYFNYSYKCNGEIISTFFGFSNFILWCVIFYYSACHWYNVYKKTNVINDIELQSNQELPSIPVTESILVTEELPSVPVTESILATEESTSFPLTEFILATEELPSVPVTESILDTEELPSVPVTESIFVTEEFQSMPISQEIMEQFPILSEK